MQSALNPAPSKVQPKDNDVAAERSDLLRRWVNKMETPVDGASLAAYRVMFSVIFILGLLSLSKIAPEYVQPAFHFSIVPGLPGLTSQSVLVLFGIMAVCAANVGMGLFYRFSAFVLFASTGYLLLLEKACYLNQTYLLCLLSFLLAIVPANRVFALDNSDKKAPRTVPTWCVLIFKVQIALIYIFGAIGDLNSDWINGYTQLNWIMKHTHDKVLAPLLTQQFSMGLITYGAIFLQLAIGVMILNRRTAWLAIILMIPLHGLTYSKTLTNIMPWLIFTALTLCLSPSWPRQTLVFFLRLIKRRKTEEQGTETTAQTDYSTSWKSLALLAVAHVYILIQLLLPLRQFLYPANTSWAELGSRFSWSLVAPTKSVKLFRIASVDKVTGERKEIDARKLLYGKQYGAMVQQADMIVQFAHEVAQGELRTSKRLPSVYVTAVESLNGRPEQNLVAPTVDLASENLTISKPSWVVPLK